MAGQRFKIENGLLAANASANSVFTHKVDVTANLSVSGDLLFVGGNLYVAGDQIISGTTTYDTDIIPLNATGVKLGNTTNRFDAYFRNIIVDGFANPSTNNVSLGNTTARWDGNFASINAANTVTINGNTTFNANVTVSGVINTSTANLGNTTITGTVNITSMTSISGNLTVANTSLFTNTVNVSSNVSSYGLVLNNASIFSNNKTVTLAGNTTIDSFPKTSSSSAKLLVSINKANTTLHITEMLLIHDGTNVLITRYGELYNTNLGDIDAAINNANVEIYFSPFSTNTYTVSILRQNLF